jgi:putative membrane protein
MGNLNKAVALTDYFVSLPKSRYLVGAMLVLGVLFGIGVSMERYSGLELLVNGSFQGLMILSFPAILSMLIIKLLIYRVPFKHIAATTLICELIYAITYSIGLFIFSFSPSYSKFVFLIGAGAVFVIWYATAKLVFTLKWRSFLFAVIQLFFNLVFLLGSRIMDFGSGPVDAMLKFYLAALVFMIAMYLFFLIINAPMRRNFGFSSTDAFSMFAAQWLHQDQSLDEAFDSVGEVVKVPLALFAFERKNNERIFFVVPSIHFGPFGNLGGSEFSYLIANKISEKYKAKSFVFHSAATHDLNPISSEELGSVMGALEDCLKGAKFSNSKVSFISGKYEECFSENLLFDDSIFITLSRAPLVTEDINFGLGAMLASEAEKQVKTAAIVDQHNAETGEVTSFEPGSIIGYNYLSSIQDAFSKPRIHKKPLQVGISMAGVTSPFIGNAGIKVAVFSSEPNVALVLLDSNGIAPEYREKLIAEVKLVGERNGKVLHPIILTTDTHQINSVKGVLNPLTEDAAITKQVCVSVSEAMLDMSDAKFFSSKKWFEIKVLGAKQSIEIVSTVNSIVAVAKIAAPIVLIGSIAVMIAVVSSL